MLVSLQSNCKQTHLLEQDHVKESSIIVMVGQGGTAWIG